MRKVFKIYINFNTQMSLLWVIISKQFNSHVMRNFMWDNLINLVRYKVEFLIFNKGIYAINNKIMKFTKRARSTALEK